MDGCRRVFGNRTPVCPLILRTEGRSKGHECAEFSCMPETTKYDNLIHNDNSERPGWGRGGAEDEMNAPRI